MRAYLGVVDGSVSVTDFDKQIPDATARTREELNDALLPYCDDDGHCSFQHSSSMDFPEEYTDDAVLLDTIEWIMNRRAEEDPAVPTRSFSIVDRGIEIQFDSAEAATEWVRIQMDRQREEISRLRDEVNELEWRRADAKVELERIRELSRSLVHPEGA